MRASMRILLAFLTFYTAVMAFTFAGTFVHEAAHAAAWDPTEAPDVRFEKDREAAKTSLGQEKRLHIDGITYRVVYVEETTIALYPKAILLTGATLGIAPSALMPETVLGSTFYAFDDKDYETLAREGHATEWHHSALPMIANLVLAIPVWVWLIKRPGALSMAAAWTNASEWRFNLHHAEEIGIPVGLYMALSLLVMAVTAVFIGFLAGRKGRELMERSESGRHPEPRVPVSV